MAKSEITSFSGQYNFLSNFYVTPVPYMGVIWRTSEHAFQAAKLQKGSAAFDRIMRIPSPGSAKKFARSCPKALDWDDRKVQVMREVLAAKFQGNDQLKKRLLETEGARLIEGNTWGDTFWGCVRSRGSWVGDNMLGKLLMELRAELRLEVIDG